MRKTIFFIIFSSLLSLISIFGQKSLLIPQTAGDYDTTFGTGGKVIEASILGGFDLAIQFDGKIVTIGRVGPSASQNFVVARLNQNGSFDTSFDADGKVETDIAIDDDISALAIQPNGKIAVAGTSWDAVSNSTMKFTLVRYNANGSLDTSFNGTGKVITDITGTAFEDQVTTMALQNDSKILVGGYSVTSSIGQTMCTFVRYNSDGTIDNSFDTDGQLLIRLGSTSTCQIRAITLQSDGKMLAVGFIGGSAPFVVARFNINGSLDTSFGTGGVVSMPGSGYSVELQPDGKIIAGGFQGANPAVVRLNSNGTLDNTFGTSGIAQLPVHVNHFGIANSVAIQPDGKIVVGGEIISDGVPLWGGILARLTSSGTLDTSFGNAGILISPPFTGAPSYNKVKLQNDGKIVTSGFVDNQLGLQITRFLNDFVAPTTFPRSDYDGDGKSDLSVFRPSDSTWYLNRSSQGFSATTYGQSSDLIMPADFDGDNKTDVAVWRPSNVDNQPDFYVLKSSTNTVEGVAWGITSDTPIVADFDGDNKDDYCVWRSSTSDFFVLLQTGVNRHYRFGISTDKPVVADYDGDAKADFAVFRPSNGTWYIAKSTDNSVIYNQWGLTTDIPVYADYDGDGKDDIAVFRPTDGTWYIQKSSGGISYISFGTNGDIPVPGDYDGDGKYDEAVYRNGTWFVNRSASGFLAQPFGLATDKPTERYYLPQ